MYVLEYVLECFSQRELAACAYTGRDVTLGLPAERSLRKARSPFPKHVLGPSSCQSTTSVQVRERPRGPEAGWTRTSSLADGGALRQLLYVLEDMDGLLSHDKDPATGRQAICLHASVLAQVPVTCWPKFP